MRLSTESDMLMEYIVKRKKVEGIWCHVAGWWKGGVDGNGYGAQRLKLQLLYVSRQAGHKGGSSRVLSRDIPMPRRPLGRVSLASGLSQVARASLKEITNHVVAYPIIASTSFAFVTASAGFKIHRL